MNETLAANILDGFMPLLPVVVIVLLGAGVLAAFKLFLSGSKETETQLPYCLNPNFLTNAEKSFYKALYQVIGKKYLIFAKVRLADIVKVDSESGKDKYKSHNNRIQSKHVDFVIVSYDKLEPVMAIELDDSSHRSKRARSTDRFKDGVFEKAGLRLVRVPAQRGYTTEQIKAIFSNNQQQSKQHG